MILVISCLISMIICGQCFGEEFCIYGKQQGSAVAITIHSKDAGWAAFGIGKEMKGSFITAGWKNSTNGYTVAALVGKDHSIPQFSPSQDSTVSTLSSTAPSWARLSFTFVRPIKSGDNGEITKETSVIWATGDDNPVNPDSGFASFNRHKHKGVFEKVDLLSSSLKAKLTLATALVLLSTIF